MALPITSSLFLELDSDLGITLNGSDVSDWADQTAENNDLSQSTASNQPLYNAVDSGFNNHASVEFDGSSEYMQTALFTSGNITQPFTLFMVCQLVTLSPLGHQFDATTVSNRCYSHYWSGSPADTTMWAGTTWIRSGVVADTSGHIFCMEFDGASSEGFIDGDTGINWTGNPGSNDLAGLTFGSNFIGTGNFTNIKIVQAGIYDRILTDSEKDSNGNYLANRYSKSWTNFTEAGVAGESRIISNPVKPFISRFI